MKIVHLIAVILTLIGALNWGIVGVSGHSLVTLILGEGMLSSIVYILVGLSAVYLLTQFKKLI
jgi:uncharacterized membrane protein YuzA (DUF378 family)